MTEPGAVTDLSMAALVDHAASYLDLLADRLDLWAVQSCEGGWSTHQVEDNRKTADGCRRQAANLRAGRKALSDETIERDQK